MVNSELSLVALMLHRGDFSPIEDGTLDPSDFGTDSAKHVLEFIRNYSDITSGAARYPSLKIVRERFGEAIELPDPEPGDTMGALVHEVRITKLRSDLKLAADTLEVLSDVVNPLEDLPTVIKDLTRAVHRVGKDDGLELGEGLPELLERYEKGDILAQGIPWMWPSLEREFKGKRGGEFHVFVGRAKQRKTFVALADILYPVLTQGKRIMVISTEMPVQQMFMRTVATLAGIRYRELKNSQLNDAELMRFHDLAERFGKWDGDSDGYDMRLRVDFDIPPDALPPGVRIIKAAGRSASWCATQIENWKPDGVLIDSFYRLAPEGMRKSDADWKAVTSVSRGLKDIAMELNIPITGTHQLNRGAEGKVAALSNVSLADAISQDVDSLFQVITGTTSDGKNVSALWNMAAREVNINGVLINNVPCADYSEIVPIESIEQVEEILNMSDGKEDKKKGKAKSNVDEKKVAEQRAALAKKFTRESMRKKAAEEEGG